jgi:tetraacyldisaccharide 4'-kinase
MPPEAAPTDSARGLPASLQRAWQRRGVTSAVLLPLSWAFGAVLSARRRMYRQGFLSVGEIPVPVIVVGNLIVGGAGKTPAVIAIVSLLQRNGWSPGIVSRGYGRGEEAIRRVDGASTAKQVGDEPLLLARRCRVPVVVGADRVAACHELLRANALVDVIVSDDGLQHLALGRDVEILVFDERGAGNGRVLPAGPLREPLTTTPDARRLVLYNAAAPTTQLPGYTGRRALVGAVALDAWWHGESASADTLDGLCGRRVVAVAGLARPERFFAMLRERGLNITAIALSDHHDFAVLPWPASASDVIVTEKDAVKLVPGRRIGSRVWVAALNFEPEASFDAALLALLPPRHDRPLPSPDGNTPA